MARGLAATVVALALICAGCATKPSPVSSSTGTSAAATSAADQAAIDSGPQPAWVEGESADYPRLDYMTSRTRGETAEQARQQALANLGDYFVVDLGDFEMSPQQAADAADYQVLAADAAAAERVGAPGVEQILDEIEIVDQWYDAQAALYHALAAVPRNLAKAFLQQQIEALDQRTQDYINQARRNLDPFVQAGKIARAWRAQQIRSQLQTAMQRADLTGRGMPPPFDLNLMRQDAENLLTTLQIQAAGMPDEPNAAEVAQLIKGGLITQELSPAEANADYILRGRLKAAVIGERNGWALGQGQLELVLADKVTGQVLGKTQWQVEVPGLDENAAIRRVYEKTEYMLKVRMRDVLMEMAMQ